MAAVFKSHCHNCGHDWDVWVASLSVGPSPWNNETQRVFCPRCCKCLNIPRILDRNRWRPWYERLLADPGNTPEFVLNLLAHIDSQFVSSPWYRPQTIDPGTVHCPECNLPMTPSLSDGDSVICPKCGSDCPLPSHCEGFVQMFRGEDGFG